jgi:hypothetical protein
VSLQELYREYHEQVKFLMIYIREAHPVDGWWFGEGIQGLVIRKLIPQAATDVYDPVTKDERRAAAGRCEESLRYGIQTYVDEMDDPVNKAYAAMPTRLYLVGLDGRVEYAGGLGPYGFRPSELKKAIDGYLPDVEGQIQQRQEIQKPAAQNPGIGIGALAHGDKKTD